MGDATAPARTAPGLSALREILKDIRFEQTLFSLPFCLLAALVAARGWPAPATLGLILLALVAARSAAMAVNRVADAAIDARNPRTAGRAIPSGRVRRGAMAAFALAAIAVFLWAARALNELAFALAPVALLFLVGYSWTKRFTALCHVVLGATLGIAPLGAWVAVRASLADLTPWLLATGVLGWVAGFDVLYACPDAEVDRRDGLRSIPRALGVERAFAASRALHAAAVAAFVAAGLASPLLGTGWFVGLGLAVPVLVSEHRLVAPGRYERMGTAFFRLNAVFSLLLLGAGAVDVFRASP